MESNPYHAPSTSVYGSAGYAPGAAVSQGVLDQLAGTKPWVRFLSVLTFIGSGFMLIAAVSMLFLGGLAATLGAGTPKTGGSSPPMAGGPMMLGFSIFYFLLAAVYIYPGIKLWKYANRIGALLATRADIDLEGALNEQRAFWKFAGISVIAMVVLYFAAIAIFAVTTGISAAKSSGSM